MIISFSPLKYLSILLCMLHKVSGSYSLKSLFLTPKKNLASKLSNSEEGIAAGSEEIRNYFHITFGFLTRVLVFAFFQECICFCIRINSESLYHFLVISLVWSLILFFIYFYVRDKLPKHLVKFPILENFSIRSGNGVTDSFCFHLC